MEKYRYFWCDAPSPLHDVMEPATKAAQDMHKRCMALVKRVGGDGYAGTAGDMGGVTFKGEPPATEVHWKHVGRTKEGHKYYWPKRNSKAGKALYAEMRAMKAPAVGDVVTKASGLFIMRFSGRYMLKTVAGWKDGRIFIRVPDCGDGDKFPKVPDYLNECASWEMDRWFAEGRPSKEAA